MLPYKKTNYLTIKPQHINCILRHIKQNYLLIYIMTIEICNNMKKSYICTYIYIYISYLLSPLSYMCIHANAI